jgi:hypothetical protein
MKPTDLIKPHTETKLNESYKRLFTKILPNIVNFIANNRCRDKATKLYMDRVTEKALKNSDMRQLEPVMLALA